MSKLKRRNHNPVVDVNATAEMIQIHAKPVVGMVMVTGARIAKATLTVAAASTMHVPHNQNTFGA